MFLNVRLLLVVLLLVLSFGILIGCKRDGAKDNKLIEVRKIENDSTAKAERQREQEPEPISVSYHLVHLTDSTRKALTARLDSNAMKTLLAINRIDMKYLRRLDSIVLPDTFLADFNAYAPFPSRLPMADSVRKLLLCSYPSQSFAAYENGRLVKWGPASLGKKSTPTPTGLFHTNWKSKSTVSTDNPDWILNWYFNLTNFRGVSLHEYELPGYPASHACVRLREADAFWIYHWADQWRLTPDGRSIRAYGTPTLIYGEYEFGAPRPWYGLPRNPDALTLTNDNASQLLQPHVTLILQRQVQRDSVLAEIELEKQNAPKPSVPVAHGGFSNEKNAR